jgi:hypothetical protein
MSVRSIFVRVFPVLNKLLPRDVLASQALALLLLVVLSFQFPEFVLMNNKPDSPLNNAVRT